MASIQVLPQHVADQIAAGEVAERPSAVVKELVENAIDAGASRITVEIRRGGVEYIRVTDNGSGIPSAEVATAFLRHATSKLHEIDDLERLGTMGFRGEALASICAVACVEVITKTADEEEGTYLKVEHGVPQPKEPVACAGGTSMIVNHLFENVPARMKFLKKDATEAGYVSDLLGRIAFSRPDIAFQYICDGKEVFSTLGDGVLKNVVLKVYGLETAKKLIEIDYQENGLGVSGVLGAPELSRGNRTRQTVLVNGRYIKNHVVSKIVEDAYRNMVMVGKFPVFILNIKMEPQFVDVNVHPAKTEVKFANEKLLYDFLYRAVKSSLYQRQHVPQPLAGNTGDEPAPGNKIETAEAAGQSRGRSGNPEFEPKISRKTISEYLDYTTPELGRRPSSSVSAPVEQQEWNPALDILDETVPAEEKTVSSEGGVSDAEPFRTGQNDFPQDTQTATEPVNVSAFGRDVPREAEQLSVLPEGTEDAGEEDYRVVGQVFRTYLILEKGDQMFLVDQHAAHERLRFEKLREDYRQHRRFGQVLLSPIVVSLSQNEFLTAMEQKEILQNLGFEAEEFGANAVIIRQTPVVTDEAEIKDLFLEILETLQEGRGISVTEQEERMLDMISCKYAIKANKKLSPLEQEDLAKQISELERRGINTCPHGRPIKLAFTKKDLEKMFKRIV